MIKFIARRLLFTIPTLFIISMIVFIVIDLPPGDFLSVEIAELEAQGGSGAGARLHQLRERYGLDDPIYIRYWLWISNFVRGDLGQSFEYKKPVSELILDSLPLTLSIDITAIIITWLLAIPIGIYSATHPYSLSDYFFTILGFIGVCIPAFLLALVVLFFFIFVFQVSPSGLFSPEYAYAEWSFARLVDLLKHVWAPIIIIGAQGMALLMRVMRNSLLEVLGKEYIQTARAKGLKEKVVIYKHGVRVAINPLISIAGMYLPLIISADVIVAIVMGLPTIGLLFWRALLRQDMFLAGACLMLYACALIIGNLIADIVLAWTDPRIKYT